MESILKNYTWDIVKQPNERKMLLVSGSSRKRMESHMRRILNIKIMLLQEGSYRENGLILTRYSHQ